MRSLHYYPFSIEFIKILSFFSIISFLTSCAPAVQNQSFITPDLYPSTINHYYDLTVTDINGIPIEGVQIDYEVINQGVVIKQGASFTESNGKLSETISATVKSDYEKMYPTTYHKSIINYIATKDGYFIEEGDFSINDSRSFKKDYPEYSQNPKKGKITLIRYVNYLSPAFVSSEKSMVLTPPVIAFIKDIKSLKENGPWWESYLKFESIDMIYFKEKNYLQFTFDHSNIYNSLRSSKYDIGKIIYDKITKKALASLIRTLGDQISLDGFDVRVIAYTADASKYHPIPGLSSSIPGIDTPFSIEYRFLIPRIIAKRYVDQDISGQELLDKSIIIMDSERINLILQ